MPLGDFKVGYIVRWCDLNNAGAKFWVYRLVCYYFDFNFFCFCRLIRWQIIVYRLYLQIFSNVFFITLVIGVYCQSSVANLSFWSDRGEGEWSIFYKIKFCCFWHIVNLKIGY